MIFVPYADELEVINNIHKYTDTEYIIIRLTKTMIEKNNIDANGLFRDLLLTNKLVDYDVLEHGGQNGVKYKANFVIRNTSQEVTMNFYRVNNKRGDRRFSIYGIKNLNLEMKVNVGDLLYITVNNQQSSPKLYIMNLTHHQPTTEILMNIFGHDKIEDSLSRLIPMIKSIAKEGYHPNSKGIGKASPKDSGDTLEYLLGIDPNNSTSADFEDTIELKAKVGKTLDTLFTLRPKFEGTPVANFEEKDRSRVSAFTRMYGYDSDKHIGYKSLYITIGSEEAPQNSLGFYLELNEDSRIIELRKKTNSGSSILTAFWHFDDLKYELQKKHPATLWVKAKMRTTDNITEFKYIEAELSRTPQFATFLSLIKSGGITYDWRGYTTPEGKYQGKNHGNAWRIRSKYRNMLFGSMETIDLL